MAQSEPDKLNYVRIPKGFGARAEMVRMAYVLAGRPYVDVLWSFAEARQAVQGKNPFNQFPFVETADGKIVYETLAIMHHAAHGTPAWPDDPERLTEMLSIAIGGYDLYQAFGGFAADDLAAKKKFEERRAPQYLGGLEAIYSGRTFAAGEVPTVADCIVHQAVAWVVRRNDVCKGIFESSPGLTAFRERFEGLPKIREFMQRQAKAREADDSV
jgi:glutathione S-transferase